MTRVFLTGGSGLIGGALAARLAERGDEVVAMARSDSAERKLAAGGARVVRGDVLDEDAMAAGMAGCAVDVPRGRHQHDVPHRPVRSSSTSTCAARRPRCVPLRAPACRGWC